MLAAVYHGPEDLRVEERPMPAIGSNEALLKVVSAGICGTDLRILHGGHPKDRPTIQFDSNLVHYKELRVTGTTASPSDDTAKAVTGSAWVCAAASAITAWICSQTLTLSSSA